MSTTYVPQLNVTVDSSGKIVSKGNTASGGVASSSVAQDRLKYVAPGGVAAQSPINPVTGTPWGQKPAPANIPPQTVDGGVQSNPIRNAQGEIIGYDTGKQSVMIKPKTVSSTSDGMTVAVKQQPVTAQDVITQGNIVSGAARTVQVNQTRPSGIVYEQGTIQDVSAFGVVSRAIFGGSVFDQPAIFRTNLISGSSYVAPEGSNIGRDIKSQLSPINIYTGEQATTAEQFNDPYTKSKMAQAVAGISMGVINVPSKIGIQAVEKAAPSFISNFMSGKPLSGSIYKTVPQVIGEKTTTILTSENAKKAATFIGIQATSEAGYALSSELPNLTRGGIATVVSPDIKYNPSAEDIEYVRKGFAGANVELTGGMINYVNEKGEPIIDTTTGKQKMELVKPSVGGIESYFYQNIPGTKILPFIGKPEVVEKNLRQQIMKSPGYLSAPNKEAYLNKAIAVEMYGGGIGSILGQASYETASEIGLSNVASKTIPFTSKFVGNKAGLFLGLTVPTTYFGYREGGKTVETMASAERVQLTPEQIQSAQVQGLVSATTVNAVLGATLPYKQGSFFSKKTGLNVGKVAYYGTQGVAYFYDPFEFGMDKLIEKTGVKGRLGINVSVPSSIFVNTSTKTQGGTKTDKVGVAPDYTLFNNEGNKTGIAIPNKVELPVDSSIKTDSTTKIISDTINNTPSNTQNQVQNFFNTSTTTQTSTSTTTNTNVLIPTIVSPKVPFLPFMGFGDSSAFGAKGSGRKRTKYYNELGAAFASFKGLDYGLVSRKKKGRSMTFLGKNLQVGKIKRRK